MSALKNLQIGIGAIVKESSTTLLEWIAYHRVIGVDHFWIADNGCESTTRQLLLDLHRIGIINYLYFPVKSSGGSQLPAYKKILAHAGNFEGVIAFIDADEFLIPEEDSLRPSLEERFRDESVSAIALNWACFGSSGALFAEDGLVIERFTLRARQTFGPNHHIKSIVRPERVKEFVNGHFAKLRQGRYTNAAGHKLVTHPNQGMGLSANVLWNGARVNHYAVKSFEEFLLEKHTRGCVTDRNRVLHKQYFVKHDQNDEQCLLAVRFAPQVHAEISRLKTKRDQLQSFLYTGQRDFYQKLTSTDGLVWMCAPQQPAAAGGNVTGCTHTPILHDPLFEQSRLLEVLSTFTQRLFHSNQYRLASKIGALIRTLLGRKEKRSLPEIKIRQALKQYQQLKKSP